MQTLDFRVVSDSSVPGISLVFAMNEDAYNYLCEEDITVLPNGSAPIETNNVGDFISDAGWNHFACALL